MAGSNINSHLSNKVNSYPKSPRLGPYTLPEDYKCFEDLELYDQETQLITVPSADSVIPRTYYPGSHEDSSSVYPSEDISSDIFHDLPDTYTFISIDGTRAIVSEYDYLVDDQDSKLEDFKYEDCNTEEDEFIPDDLTVDELSIYFSLLGLNDVPPTPSFNFIMYTSLDFLTPSRRHSNDSGTFIPSTNRVATESSSISTIPTVEYREDGKRKRRKSIVDSVDSYSSLGDDYSSTEITQITKRLCRVNLSEVSTAESVSENTLSTDEGLIESTSPKLIKYPKLLPISASSSRGVLTNLKGFAPTSNPDPKNQSHPRWNY